jgi:hypothetical protein
MLLAQIWSLLYDDIWCSTPKNTDAFFYGNRYGCIVARGNGYAGHGGGMGKTTAVICPAPAVVRAISPCIMKDRAVISAMKAVLSKIPAAITKFRLVLAIIRPL